MTYPGKPDYEDVESGDEAEAGFYLFLHPPTCIRQDSLDSGQGTADGGRVVQLLLDQAGYERLRPLLDTEITLQGTVSEGISGHHHTLFLLTPILR